jgi:cardiolipin synthase
MYFSWGSINSSQKQIGALKRITEIYSSYGIQSEEVQTAFVNQFPEYERIARYLSLNGFPLYKAGRYEYYPVGENYFDGLLEELEKAERFIFFEYFIISDGEIWEKAHKILKEKAAAGVDVRILYDDGGSLFTIHSGFKKELKKEGIQVRVFNPVHKALKHFHLNYRNHRKITVIDGKVGYTGGINIGDEYANLYVKHGHWKDTAIALYGPVVRTMTLMFLQMWDFCSGVVSDNIEQFLRAKDTELNGKYVPGGSGYVQFLTDSPVNNPKNPAETTYLQIVNYAKSYVYITTPYLIIDNLMINALCSAAQSGADVRIITPGIPDKWFVHATTRSFYGRLLRQGVRIFEYTPGFMHAKMIVSDDTNALIGSINMDFRSFFLHDECALLVCGSPVVGEILADIRRTMDQCEEISPERMNNRSVLLKIVQSLLKLFSPMM